MDTEVLPRDDKSIVERSTRISSELPTPNRFPSSIPSEIPPEVQKWVSYVIDPNYTLEQVDEAFGYPSGESRRLLKTYEPLRRLTVHARDFAIREAGLSKVEAFKVYKDGMEAERTTADGETEVDHKTRIMAADRVLTLLGEKPTSGGGVNVLIENNKTEINNDVRMQIIKAAREAVQNEKPRK